MYFSYQKHLLSKMVLKVARCALDRYNDPKIQFNSLLLIDHVFRYLMIG